MPMDQPSVLSNTRKRIRQYLTKFNCFPRLPHLAVSISPYPIYIARYLFAHLNLHVILLSYLRYCSQNGIDLFYKLIVTHLQLENPNFYMIDNP